VGEEEVGHCAASRPVTPRDGSGAPAAAATDGIGRGGRGWRKRRGRPGQRKREGPAACRAEEEGGAGRPGAPPRAAGRGRVGRVGFEGGVGCIYTRMDPGWSLVTDRDQPVGGMMGQPA
jgi:hypothetical protein